MSERHLAELERYKKALEFYADKQNYMREYGVDGLPYLDKPTPIQKDGGKTARNVLEAN
ncbi:hypothetical protein [Neobacillus sp. DY30]|uniref:hypothetical protein n=1 Tax=Neobacillus sp. DY30 TaxID=3047871 RepID=UPI0024BFCBF3|nr:hypothetical protein [Neobacillus sp. DY30]WHY01856.1 hypothetical protein QNH29_06405 [Neobacillus sp. DY30]